MQKRVELVFFKGCPNLPRARQALRDAGISGAIEVVQDDLAPGDKLRGLSSPSILVDGAVLVGLRDSASACTVADWSRAAILLKAACLKS